MKESAGQNQRLEISVPALPSKPSLLTTPEGRKGVLKVARYTEGNSKLRLKVVYLHENLANSIIKRCVEVAELGGCW